MADLVLLGQLIVNGIVVGSVLTLAAVGLTLVYGILNLANFAHGDFLTLGAYLALFFSTLIVLQEAVTWALALVVLLVGLVVWDRVVKPRLAGRAGGLGLEAGSRIRPPEVLGLGILVAGILSIVAGTQWSLDVDMGTGAAVTALAFASIAVPTATLATVRGAAPRVLMLLGAGGAAVVGVALVVLHVVFPGPRPLFGWSITLSLLPLAGVSVLASPDPSRDRGLLGAAGAGLLVAAYLVANQWVLAVVVALAAVCIVSVVLELLIWRPVRRKGGGLLTLVIVSIGLALAMRHAIVVQWGLSRRPFPGTLLRGIDLLGSNILITPFQLLTVVITLASIAGLHLLLRYTRIGKGMRALADDIDLARVTGIDVDRVIVYVWIIAGFLIALAGVLLGLTRPIHPNLGWNLLLPIFASVILGGIGSPYGAMAGGFTIGIAMEASIWFGVPTPYTIAVGFGIMILVLILRPQGIFGGQATR